MLQGVSEPPHQCLFVAPIYLSLSQAPCGGRLGGKDVDCHFIHTPRPWVRPSPCPIVFIIQNIYFLHPYFNSDWPATIPPSFPFFPAFVRQTKPRINKLLSVLSISLLILSPTQPRTTSGWLAKPSWTGPTPASGPMAKYAGRHKLAVLMCIICIYWLY